MEDVGEANGEFTGVAVAEKFAVYEEEEEEEDDMHSGDMYRTDPQPNSVDNESVVASPKSVSLT